MKKGLVTFFLFPIWLLAAAVTGTAEPAHQRSLALDNTLNSRDLGGYKTIDGRRLKWGMLFRSDSLAQLNDSDLAKLASLRLAAVTDFRSDQERAEAPDLLPQQSPAIAYRTLSINNPGIDVAALGRKFYSGQLSEPELVALMDRTPYVNDDQLRSQWGQWLRGLAEPGALPHLFHCTAGKDRTGFAAALILLTLGVPREQVMDDFLLSNEYLGPKIDPTVEKIQLNSSNPPDAKLLRQVVGVSPRSLEDAFAAMEAKYGSIDGYIEQGLGIDSATREELRRLLLE